MSDFHYSDPIATAARYIREGKLVAFPTETVYGLGADATNPMAVSRIFELKERPTFDPLIVHIGSIDDIGRYTHKIDSRVIKLAERFWPGPLTMVLPKNDLIPDIVTSGLPTVGIRMPNNDIALELIRQSQRPIAAPSANKFGRVSPTHPDHVRKQLPDVDYILDGGRTLVGIESTIISVTEKGFSILRHGIITREEIEKILPYCGEKPSKTEEPAAPGMLKSHYSPNKPLYFTGDTLPANLNKKKAALIAFTLSDNNEYATVLHLTSNANLKEYAVNLFAALHQLEADSTIDFIVVEPVPETGIGIAIMDRLRRAGFKYKS